MTIIALSFLFSSSRLIRVKSIISASLRGVSLDDVFLADDTRLLMISHGTPLRVSLTLITRGSVMLAISIP